jgi:hypothetical protein
MNKSPNVLANNAKALSSVLGNPANSGVKANSPMTAMANAMKSNSAVSAIKNVASSVTEGLRSSATNSMNNIANSIRSINTSIATPLKESIASIPSSAPSLGVSLPLIFGIGILVIALALIVFYRSTIESGLSDAYEQVKKYFQGTTTGSGSEPEKRKPHPMAQNPLEYPPQSQDLPDSATDVINKLVPGRKQVFNVSANKYTYSDAEPLCKALGAQLATYDQVKQAWDEGADWCNYGWVKGQAAVYPTQKSTFDELQGGSTDDERLACGQPGVNGGFFDNPELRFGVNCYGDKPSQSSNDLRVTNENARPPLTADALGQKKKELAYKSEIDQIGLLPFKAHTWSK